MSKYNISGKEFKTKAEIRKYVQSILAKYEPKEKLALEDYEFIYGLLKLHPDSGKKIGCGIKRFEKVISAYGKNAFEIVRIDNSRTDFSYVNCLHPKSELADLRKACRNAIKDDIIKFKKDSFECSRGILNCPLTGKTITKANSHVDHMPPITFNYIFQESLKQGVIAKDTEVLGYEDGDQDKYFKNSKDKEAFRQFHNKQAKLRITSMLGNLSHSKLENSALAQKRKNTTLK